MRVALEASRQKTKEDDTDEATFIRTTLYRLFLFRSSKKAANFYTLRVKKRERRGASAVMESHFGPQ